MVTTMPIGILVRNFEKLGSEWFYEFLYENDSLNEESSNARRIRDGTIDCDQFIPI